MWSALLLLFACWGDNAYIVEGTVVKVTAADEVIIDHKEIPGFMDAMTMPFHVEDPALIADLKPGDTILARFEVEPHGGFLRKVRVTGHGPAPAYEEPGGTAPMRVGQVLPASKVTLADGTSIVVGEGQDKPTALTFLYTRCPLPEYCPATVAKYQALQEAVGPDVRLLAVTLDPDNDTTEVLTAFAKVSNAKPDIWQFGRAEALETLATHADLGIVRQDEGVEILHAVRMLVLDAEGKVVERYEDHEWPASRVAEQLRTGAPLGLR